MQGEETDRVRFFDRVTDVLGKSGYMQLVHAYQLYKALHRGQERRDGTRYVTHPRAVAEILLDYGPSSFEEVIAALLHDTVEDAFILPEFILHVFGPHVADAVDVLSVYDLRLRDHGTIEKRELEKPAYYARIAESSRLPRRVKCADRIHNLRTMHAMGTDHQRKKVAETRTYIIRIARATDKLMADELEHLCDRYEAAWAVPF